MERLPSRQEPPMARSYLEVLRKYQWLLITTSLAKVGEERQKIAQAEWALQAFRERENILTPQGVEDILVKKIAMLNEVYVQTRVKRLEMDSQTQMLQRIAKDPKMAEPSRS